jgi:Flp pilus assembly protein TadD
LIYDRLDSLDQTEQLYERAIRLSDSAAVYMNNLAYTFAQRGLHLDRAKILATQALKLDPDNASYLDTMGWIEYQLRHYEEAVRWLKKAIKIDPNNAEVHEHLGDVYDRQGSQSKARSSYERTHHRPTE